MSKKKNKDNRKVLTLRYLINENDHVSFVDPCCDEIPARLFGLLMEAISNVERRWNNRSNTPYYFIVFTNETADQIRWPESYTCKTAAIIPNLIAEYMHIAPGEDFKMNWTDEDTKRMAVQYNVEIDEVVSYNRAPCYAIYFDSSAVRDRAVLLLKDLGATAFVSADSFRDVILQQCHYHNCKTFRQSDRQALDVVKYSDSWIRRHNRLPDGRTCKDCYFCSKCVETGATKLTDTICTFDPGRFALNSPDLFSHVH